MELPQTETKPLAFEDIFIDPLVLNDKELKVLLDAENDLKEFKISKKERKMDF